MRRAGSGPQADDPRTELHNPLLGFVVSSVSGVCRSLSLGACRQCGRCHGRLSRVRARPTGFGGDARARGDSPSVDSGPTTHTVGALETHLVLVFDTFNGCFLDCQ